MRLTVGLVLVALVAGAQAGRPSWGRRLWAKVEKAVEVEEDDTDNVAETKKILTTFVNTLNTELEAVKEENEDHIKAVEAIAKNEDMDSEEKREAAEESLHTIGDSIRGAFEAASDTVQEEHGDEIEALKANEEEVKAEIKAELKDLVKEIKPELKKLKAEMKETAEQMMTPEEIAALKARFAATFGRRK